MNGLHEQVGGGVDGRSHRPVAGLSGAAAAAAGDALAEEERGGVRREDGRVEDQQ